MKNVFSLAALVVTALLPHFLIAQPAAKSKSGDYLVYVGSYTRGMSKGINAYRFSAKSGKLVPVGLAAETPNPSFLAIHSNAKYLYSVNESVPDQRTGTVTAFSIEKGSGKLTTLNTVASGGSLPCHLVVDKTGKTLVVVNYGNGVTTSYGIRDDGSLTEAVSTIQHKGASVNAKRQQGPHAHSVNLSADNRFAIVADLGLDEILVYKLDAAGHKIEPNDPPSVRVHPGGGPRHFAFHPGGNYAYANHEMGSYVSVLSWDAARGAFRVIQALPTLPADFRGENNTAHTDVHPSGRFVYVSNRGHDSIAVYSVDKARGTLTLVEIVSTQGQIPRNFGIDPTGQYLIAANQGSNSLVVFKIDQKSGRITPTGQNVENGAPVCLKFLPLD